MLILTESDLRSLLSMRDVIDALEKGFRALAAGHATIPERLTMELPSRTGVLLEMPAFIRSSTEPPSSALGTKIVSVFAQNRLRGLDAIQAVYLLLDPDTGVPLALMDGRLITGIRTAGTSAVATRFMAPPGSKRLAVFGAGVQAEAHIEAMIEVTEVEEIMITSRSEVRARELAAQVRSVRGLRCEIVAPDKAVTAANLICTCTSSPSPVFDGRLFAEGTHINAVGAFSASTRELDTVTVRRSRVIIDAESAAGREAGELLIPLSEGAIDAEHIKGNLSDVVSGKVAGRESASETTVFKSCGLAIEDLVTAQLAYTRAVAGGIGIEVPM